MPTLTVAGHSVTVGDEFLKLSPEEQNTTVDEIAKSLPAEKPSGVAAGFAHGVSNLASGVSSTLGLGDVKSDALNAAAAATEPTNYKAAPLIREGGHWYNPADYQLGNLPQNIAEQAPGLASDVAAGSVGSKIGNIVGGSRGAAVGGAVGGLGSMLLRTFGPGAHENADARTGTPNSPVTGSDIAREGVKQAIAAPLNVLGVNRLVPGLSSEVSGVGARAVGSALKKYMATAGTEAAAGGARDAISQVGSTIGTDKGVQYDPNKTAEAALASGATGGLLAAPRTAADIASATKFRQFGGENAEASTALANRLLAASASKKLTPEAVDAAHADVHNELVDAAKNETGLSTDNANTLKRIQSGGTANPTELTSLSTEVSPETASLARQALLSSQLKDMGNGGISGAMDNLGPLKRPGTYIGGAILGSGVPGIGHIALPALGGLYGAYGAARLFDKMTGARNSAQGFADKFGDPTQPVRSPEPTGPSAEPVTTSVPQVSPPQDTALWGNPAEPTPGLRPTLNANAKVEEGMAKIAKGIADQKRKSMITDAMPMLQQLAAKMQPPAPEVTAPAPAPPDISPIALKMAQASMKAGLPPEPTPAPVAPPVAATTIDPNALPSTITRPARNISRGFKNSARAQEVFNIATKKADGVSQAEGLAANSPLINEQGGLRALSNPEFTKRGSQLISAANTMRKLTAQPAEDTSAVPDGPASPAIGSLMQKMQAEGSMPAPKAPAPVSSMSDILANIGAPKPPIISKITKKMGKPVEAKQAPAEEQPYQPVAEDNQWRNMLTDPQVADKELAAYDPSARKKYSANVIKNREAKRDILESVANEHSPTDAVLAVKLYRDLDHISRRSVAARSIAHFTGHMSPEAASAVLANFTPQAMEKMWHRE
jgi:hypothetical protein